MKLSSKQIGVSLARKMSSMKDSGERKKYLAEVAMFIAKERKVSKLSLILQNFEKEWNILNNEVDVILTVASTGDAKFPKEFKGKKVNLKIKEDRNVIAGVEVVIGDYLYDNTVKARISKIKSLTK